MGQRFHNDHRQHRQDDDHYHKAGDERDDARRVAHLLFYQFAERGLHVILIDVVFIEA
ncbi:hypothetical protein BN135_1345 [Cronobacter muytjensii 530]